MGKLSNVRMTVGNSLLSEIIVRSNIVTLSLSDLNGMYLLTKRLVDGSVINDESALE